MNAERNEHFDENMAAWLREHRDALAARLSTDVDLDGMLQRVKDKGAAARSRREVAGTAKGGLSLNWAAAEVGKFFRRNPDSEFDDYDVCKDTGLLPSQTYPALQSFLAAGWIEERWQTDAEPGEPRRAFYRLTDDGRAELGQVIAEHEAQHRLGRLGSMKPAFNDQ